MQKLIKNAEIIDNTWQVLDKDFEDATPEDKSFVPLKYLLKNTELLERAESIGVWLDSDEEPAPLEPLLGKIKHIAINFPKFADGRGYSYARILRDKYKYEGELRAIGDVLHDQLFYMKRCGFDVFAVREDKDISAAIKGLDDFSNAYQAATVISDPLFRRR